MSIASVAVEKRALTYFVMAILLTAGAASFFGLGWLEDPEFTVKTAAIVTTYPGATAEEVELELTDRLEVAIQELPQLKDVYSCSRPGMSLIKVDIQARYSDQELPQVWDDLRKKVRDASGQLPPGAGTPAVSDDFGDVYGFLMAVTSDGFSFAELERYVDHIKKELSVVDGVARVELWGDQAGCLYVEVREAQLATLGLNMEDVYQTLTQQNLVVDAGGVDVAGERYRVHVTGEFSSPREIEELIIRGRTPDGQWDVRELAKVGDIASVRRGYVEPPSWQMRFNGEPAIGVAIANASGENIVRLGERIDSRLAELIRELPIGIEVHRISWQSDLVNESIIGFMVSLLQAVAIVLAVLWLATGFRTALIVGLCGLVFTIVASLLFMKLFGIDLQRMSLGALIVAMGMMVDNAIVVSDGVLVRLQQGQKKVKAAIEAATQPSIPLLGATVVAVMAFYPIAASDESAGEYCLSLFQVVAIALMLSWVLAVTITPLMCIGLIPQPKKGQEDVDPYAGRLYRSFAVLLRHCLRFRWGVLAAFGGLLLLSCVAFGWVDQMFFPHAARAQFMVDFWAPEGTQIQRVSSGLAKLEAKFMSDDRVTGVSTFVGQGPPRFYLPVDPEDPYSSYGQLIVNCRSFREVQPLIDDYQGWADENLPFGEVITRKYGLGPFESWPVEARFSGPAIADVDVLRRLGREASAIMADNPQAQTVRTDWRSRVKQVVADYDQVNARWTSVKRSDIADATRRAYDGMTVGMYREDDKMLPITVRHVEEERRLFPDSIDAVQVRPRYADQSLPLSQVTSGVDLGWEDTLIWRWNRRRAITVQAVPTYLATPLRNEVLADIEAIELPPGYDMEWDGEFRSSLDAQQSLIPGMIPAGIVIAIIIVALFNAYRPPLIIVLVVPFVLIGITVGLLMTGQPFGFVALLGAMSLAGMMIKNSIVLLDEVDVQKAQGKNDYDALIDSSVSRLRPVLLAAGTTVLGVIPLLGDVFWVSMAVTIMFGLAFGTLLTMLLVPVLYSIFFNVSPPSSS